MLRDYYRSLSHLQSFCEKDYGVSRIFWVHIGKCYANNLLVVENHHLEQGLNSSLTQANHRQRHPI